MTEAVARSGRVQSPRRREIEATLAGGGYAVLVDGPSRPWRSANEIAPEHLELCCDDPRATGPARAQRRRRLRRSVHARLARRLHRRSEPHAADVPLGPLLERARRRGLPAPGARRLHRPRGALPRVAPHVAAIAKAEGLSAHARSVSCAVGARARAEPVSTEARGRARIARRRDPRREVALRPGYHSPQVEVEVRLNTNESPEPPPHGLPRGALAPSCTQSSSTATPTARRPRFGRRSRPHHGVEPAPGFLRQRLERGDPVPPARLRRRRDVPPWSSSRPTRSTPTSPGSPAHLSSTGRRDDEFRVDPGRGRPHRGALGRSSTDQTPRRSASSARPTTRPAASRRPRRIAGRCSQLVPGIVVVDEAYGQFAPRSALELVAHRAAPRRAAHLLQDLGHGRAAPRLRRRRPGGGRLAMSNVALPYHLDALKQAAGRLALGFDDEMRARVAATVEESGAGRRPPSASSGSTVWPSDANFVLFRVDAARRARRSGRGCSSTPCSSATSRTGPGSRAACASRSARGSRTTVPALAAFTSALVEKSLTAQPKRPWM